MPEVSIGLVTYNRSHIIKRAIESILNQSYKDFELIISDDNSKDETEKIVKGFMNQDSRIRYIKQTNVGMTQNFLEVLKQATTEYFTWLCDDDYFHPDFLEKAIAVMKSDSSISICCGTTRFFRQTNLSDRFEYLRLDSNCPINRVVSYYKNVNSNIILYGIMRTPEIRNLDYPDTFGADLLWSSQILVLGKCIILNDTFFYYSMEGISKDTKTLSSYYSCEKTHNINPYIGLRNNASKMIIKRQSAFLRLSLLSSFVLAIRVWIILRERFCMSKYEAHFRRKLAIRTKIKWIINALSQKNNSNFS